MIDSPNTLSPLVEIAREARSSIEVSRDAKGVYRWDIKLYFERCPDDDDQEMALSQLGRIDRALRAQYHPDPSGSEGTE